MHVLGNLVIGSVQLRFTAFLKVEFFLWGNWCSLF